MAQSTRPQLASAPNIAAFKSAEPTTALAAALASASVLAPVTTQSSSFVAPSPSPRYLAAEPDGQRVQRSAKGRRSPRPRRLSSALPARPLDMMATMSFVEVSPSTVTMLKVPGMSLLSAFCEHCGAYGAVGGDEAQHRGHVGADHAAALGHAAHAALHAARREADGVFLAVRIRGHYRLGGWRAVRAQGLHKLWYPPLERAPCSWPGR